MILLDLFFGFLKVGCFAFGGAYGAIPLIRDIVLSYDWLTHEELTYMIAVSESTPGPIMVNLATYIGSAQGGLLGSIIATFAVVLPSFLLILLIVSVMKKFVSNKYVQAALRGIKPAIIGIILATGIYMLVAHCFESTAFDIKAAFITAILLALTYVLPKLIKKKLSPIMLIICSAVLGIIFF